MLYGCGEQIMIMFAPTYIFPLNYLQATNQDEPDVRAKSVHHLKSWSPFLYTVCLKNNSVS